MSNDIEAEAAAMRRAMERAVHLIGCGDAASARQLLSAYLSGVNAGRALLRTYERTTERAERCLREHLAPMVAEWERGEAAGERERPGVASGPASRGCPGHPSQRGGRVS